jgi:hypothetical protein
MHTTPTDLEVLGAMNRRFIHSFGSNDVASHDAILRGVLQ